MRRLLLSLVLLLAAFSAACVDATPAAAAVQELADVHELSSTSGIDVALEDDRPTGSVDLDAALLLVARDSESELDDAEGADAMEPEEDVGR